MAKDTFVRHNITFRDAKGVTARCSYGIWYDHASNQFVAGALVIDPLIEACSLGAVVSTSNVGPAFTAWGVQGVYQAAADKAILVFQATKGELMKLAIPCPIGSGANNIFMLDAFTVNPAAANVAALVTAITATFNNSDATFSVTNRDLQDFPHYIGGFRARRKYGRKTSLYRLDGNLDVQEPDE
jgi:hypothetical protein